MDNRKFVVDKWKNGVGERKEKKLKKTFENMGSVVKVQFNCGIGEYSVRLTNHRCLVVRLRDGTWLVVGGDDLDEDFNRRILPPKNPRGARRPRKRKVESQTQGLKPPRCSKCGDLGHYKNTYRDPCTNFDADYPAAEVFMYTSQCRTVQYLRSELEAKIVEHHDNYCRRYACYPKQDEYASGYFEEVDPQYPNRAMEVIDDLVVEMREARDVLLKERNNQYWMEEEDRAVEDGMRAELDELKGIVGVAFVAIVVLVAALLVMWSF
ncbi:hypothetical protein Cgig2_012305 [Carnegiea gigantea]|uniref:Uncharacterized protein n=1 Tax=Carnegiea gigantea TaxID=171969 RepID=A0A9Q1GU94_9CARY|nr:hypothetical protein Cgig2_012305 [Carnegiea gigantea]